jgi:hypothetical protein
VIDPDLLPPPRRAESGWDAPCAALACLLPLILGVWSSGAVARWQDDLGIVRDLGLIPAGTEGALSSVLSQLFALVPIAGRGLRAGLVGVCALAACGALSFCLLRALLDARQPFGPNPLLALLGSQIWALSPLVLSDAGAPGSGALGLLTILFGLLLTRHADTDARVFPLAGALLGLSWGENHTAALLLLLVLLADWLCAGARVEPMQTVDLAAESSAESTSGEAVLAGAPELSWLRFVACCALGAGTCALVPWLRSWAPNTWVDLGLGSLPAAADSGTSAGWLGWSDTVRQVLALPLERLGSGGGLLALVGAGLGFAERDLRRRLLPWAVLVLGGLLGPLVLTGETRARELCVLAASMGMAAFVPLGLQSALYWLWSCPVPFARPASVLAGSFAVTLVLQRVESAVPREPELGTEIWTDEALGRLPAQSVLLVQSPALALRFLSAQVLQGTRPDVLTVPLALLHRGSVSEQLLRRDPALRPLLRQLAVNGAPDEYSLGRLADTRPVFVELDPRWDARLLDHLRPDALWLAFAPHALGKSERRAGVERARAALGRLLTDPDVLRSGWDERTRQVLARQARELAARLERGTGRVAVNELLAGTPGLRTAPAVSR